MQHENYVHLKKFKDVSVSTEMSAPWFEEKKKTHSNKLFIQIILELKILNKYYTILTCKLLNCRK